MGTIELMAEPMRKNPKILVGRLFWDKQIQSAIGCKHSVPEVLAVRS